MEFLRALKQRQWTEKFEPNMKVGEEAFFDSVIHRHSLIFQKIFEKTVFYSSGVNDVFAIPGHR